MTFDEAAQLFFDELAAQCVAQYGHRFADLDDITFQQLDNQRPNCRGLRGRIVRTGPNGHHESGHWLIRYFHLRPPQPQLGFHVFSAEWRFYAQILPAFERLRPLRQVVPLSCWRFDGRRAGLMLRLPDQFEEAQSLDHLDYAHLSLMAAAIGKFHSYSFQLTADQVASLSEGLRPYEPHLSYCRLVMPALRRCLDALIASGYLNRCANMGGFWRLLKMVLTLDEELRTLAERRCSYEVFSHQHYTREQVTFLYVEGVPEASRIVEWRSVGWTSLGVDLATLLYVECDGAVREEDKFKLLSDYWRGLRSTFDRDNLPSWHSMMVEIQNCIPVALCILGLRNSHPSGLWDDQFIMQVYEDLVETYMVYS